MMNALLIVSLAVFAVYLTDYFVRFREVPPSLSATYYSFEERYGRGSVFTIALLLMAFTIIAPMIECSLGSPFQFLAFLCPAAIAFVGAAPKFRDTRMESRVHTIAALLSALCGCLWVILVAKMWWMILVSVALVVLVAFLTKSYKQYTWWLEMIVFVAVYSTLLIM